MFSSKLVILVIFGFSTIVTNIVFMITSDWLPQVIFGATAIMTSSASSSTNQPANQSQSVFRNIWKTKTQNVFYQISVGYAAPSLTPHDG